MANPDCHVHVCQVLPRGDVDVSSINMSIRRVSDHWKMQNVKCVAETYSGVPYVTQTCSRSFSLLIAVSIY